MSLPWKLWAKYSFKRANWAKKEIKTLEYRLMAECLKTDEYREIEIANDLTFQFLFLDFKYYFYYPKKETELKIETWFKTWTWEFK